MNALAQHAQRVIDARPDLADACATLWYWHNRRDHRDQRRGPVPETVRALHDDLRAERLAYSTRSPQGHIRQITLTQVGTAVALRTING